MSPYTATWLSAFAVTVVVEVTCAVPLLAPSGAAWARRAGIVVLANLASHPIVWFVFPESGLFGTERLAASELFAVVVETAAYLLVWPAIGPVRAFGTSALANGASLSVGLVMRALGAAL